MAGPRKPLLVQVLAAAASVLTIGLGNHPSQAANAHVVHRVGEVTRHAAKFVDQDVIVEGYVLATEPGYVIFSDEPTGKITIHDLPVGGAGTDTMQPMKKYLIEGVFLDHGLKASNDSAYHLELVAPPSEPQR